MSAKPSILSNINSKFILRQILLFTGMDIKSVFKLMKYNKHLQNKYDINPKHYFDYKLKRHLGKKYLSNLPWFVFSTIKFIVLLVYAILVSVRGTFNETNY